MPPRLSEIGEAIARVAPDLRGAPRPIGDGLDNRAYELDGWVFRFARSAETARFLHNEIARVPAIAPRLPVSVSVAERVGEHAGLPFAGHRKIEGRSAEDVAPTRELAAALGRFVRALHDVDLGDVDGAPVPGVGKNDRARALQNLARWTDAPALLELAHALDAPPCDAPRWVHGDLYPRHVLVDDGGGLAGVIDWGDVHRGDPAVDLAIALGWLDGASREAFFDAYGERDAATETRARFLALYYAVAFAHLAEERGDEGMRGLAERYRAVVVRGP